MFANGALLAIGFGEIIEIVGAIVFVIVYGLNHLIMMKKQGQAPQRRVQPPRPVAQGQSPPKNLNDEIAEFVKRAAERRQGQQGERREAPANPPVARPAPARQVSQPKPAAKPPTRRSSEGSPRPKVKEGRPTGESVSRHVREHLTTSEFEVRAEHMTADLAKADVERREHEQKMFSHQLGKLGSESAAEARPTDSPAVVTVAALSPLATLLSNPDNLRQAIIMQEILNRPEW